MNFGCSTCQGADDGYLCSGSIGSISTCKAICGDNKRMPTEKCDNGNKTGCSVNCNIDFGFYCKDGPNKESICETKCGDYMLAST